MDMCVCGHDRAGHGPNYAICLSPAGAYGALPGDFGLVRSDGQEYCKCMKYRKNKYLWKRLKAIVSGVLNMSFFATQTCTNCGKQDYGMPHCAMRDRCIESQNANIRATITIEQMADEFKTGKCITVDHPRPLCFKCATESGYVCWSCELEQKAEA